MINKNVQIISVEAKDVISGKCAIVNNQSTKNIELLKESGHRILRKYKGSMDYSLLTIHLQEISKKIVKFNKNTQRYYSNDIMTVNFNYALTEGQYNDLLRALNKLFTVDILKSEKSVQNKLKISITGKINRLKLKEIKDIDKITKLESELKVTDNKIIHISEDILHIEEEIIIIKKGDTLTTDELRADLYENGFNININGRDTKMVRFLRSSGSARTGKINFINETYYEKLIKWCMAGIEYKNSTTLDLPSLESYISLVASSIIDTFELKAENILLIEEGTSTFTNTVMATELINQVKDENDNIISGDLFTSVQDKEITNTIFDGESLLSKEIFESKGYSDKAILQIRNKFYKGIGVNTDIQQFFFDNEITEISQLNGITLATDISQIKLICTKSSIKYLKYSTFEKWTKVMQETWAICKFEKDQHNFNGMAQSHYQLINTLGMDFEATKELSKDTLHYIYLLNNDISVFKLHLGIIKAGGLDAEEDEEATDEEVTELDSIKTNSDFILSMLKVNEDFAKTPICRKFKYEVVENYKKNVLKGHILIDGTYATVVSSVYEYLLCSIGKWNGVSSTLGIDECFTAKYPVNEKVLGVRSPQPTMSCMTVFNNSECGVLKDYFNVESKNVIYISAIGWNIFERESSMDVDGDAMLITNQKTITEHCLALDENVVVEGKTVKRFLVSNDFTPKTSIARSYTPIDLTDTDIKCAEGKIGECINLVQMLNSVYWTMKYNNASEEDLMELYKDIATLNVLSCVIIDSCKKSSPVSIDGEMNKIRAKGYLGKGNITRDGKVKKVGIRPKFFKYLDGGKDYKFVSMECGMDYLVKIMMDKSINPRKDRDNENGNVTLKSMLMKQKTNDSDRKKISSVVHKITLMQIDISNICKSKDNGKEKFRQMEEVRAEAFIEIGKIEITTEMIYTIVKRLSDAYSTEDKFQAYRKIGRNILKTLYSVNPTKFLTLLQVKPNISGTIIRKVDGEIDIYGVKFTKIAKK